MLSESESEILGSMSGIEKNINDENPVCKPCWSLTKVPLSFTF